jgi:hypothetical protein
MRSNFSAATETDEGDACLVMEHAARFCNLRDHAAMKEKQRHFIAIQLQIGLLKAEKRQLLIQQSSIPPGTNKNLVSILSMLIAEVDDKIDSSTQQPSDVNTSTPQKSNRSPMRYVTSKINYQFFLTDCLLWSLIMIFSNYAVWSKLW